MNAIQKYFRYRQSLIDQYVKGDMTKREYLQKNYDAVINSNIKPFQNTDTVEKALYNYQYFNALAKQMKSISEDFKDYEMKQVYMEKSDYYYSKKDKATNKILRMLDFRGVEAYFVKVKSKNLKGKLFEIVLLDYNVILHSTNDIILNLLKQEEVFYEQTRQSLIDEYINHKY